MEQSSTMVDLILAVMPDFGGFVDCMTCAVGGMLVMLAIMMLAAANGRDDDEHGKD